MCVVTDAKWHGSFQEFSTLVGAVCFLLRRAHTALNPTSGPRSDVCVVLQPRTGTQQDCAVGCILFVLWCALGGQRPDLRIDTGMVANSRDVKK